MSPTRILFTIPNFITAGSGRAMLNVIERLDRRRFTPFVCVNRRGGKLDAVVEGMGIPLLEAETTVSARPLHTLYGRVKRVAATFRPHGFDLWHSFHYLDDYTEPLVARAAGTRAWLFTKKNMSWNRRAWLVRSVLASRVAVQNSDMLQMFYKGPLFRGKVTLIRPGVDATQYVPDVPHRLKLRTSLGISESSLLVGCVAALRPIKGQATLIRAIKEVPDAHAVLAGPTVDTNFEAGLKRLTAELGVTVRVHMLGPVNDVQALLPELDIFVLPSLPPGEGCPVALLEAMSTGRACVTSDVPGCREAVVNGRSGLLFPPGDHEALAGALTALNSPDVRKSFGEEARRRVLEFFTLEQEARAYEQMYAELVGESRV